MVRAVGRGSGMAPAARCSPSKPCRSSFFLALRLASIFTTDDGETPAAACSTSSDPRKPSRLSLSQPLPTGAKV